MKKMIFVIGVIILAGLAYVGYGLLNNTADTTNTASVTNIISPTPQVLGTKDKSISLTPAIKKPECDLPTPSLKYLKKLFNDNREIHHIAKAKSNNDLDGYTNYFLKSLNNPKMISLIYDEWKDKYANNKDISFSPVEYVGFYFFKNSCDLKKQIEEKKTALTKASYFGAAIKKEGLSYSTVFTLANTKKPFVYKPAIISPTNPYSSSLDDLEKERSLKKKKAFAATVMAAVAFESSYSGANPYSANNYSNDSISFNYIGNNLSSAHSSKYGTASVSYIGDELSSFNSTDIGSYYCSYIGDKISSCNNYNLGNIYYNFIGDKISSASNYTNSLNVYFSYIGDKLSSATVYGLGTYYIN